VSGVLIAGARVLTLVARGEGDVLGVLPEADVLVEDGVIVAVGSGLDVGAAAPDVRRVAAEGRVLMPGFIDCHTHACWAGDRLDEWRMILAGAAYLEILEAGGGIMATVRAVRRASADSLRGLLERRLTEFLRLGTTTVEVKSGYGLTPVDELKMLDAIILAAEGWPGTVVPTALLGHALDPDQPDFVARTVAETLPAVHERFPRIAVDAYCERGSWSVAEASRLFDAARALGHPVRVHADQFTSMGMVSEAIRLGAASVDHLEASTAADLVALASAGVPGVILPICGLHLGRGFARPRSLLDAGGVVAVATNYNPGSAPSQSMPLAIGAAVRRCGISPAEAIAGCTVNAAKVLGLRDRGVIATGRRADLILLRHTDERMLAYELGGNPVDLTICGGRIVNGSTGPRLG